MTVEFNPFETLVVIEVTDAFLELDISDEEERFGGYLEASFTLLVF